MSEQIRVLSNREQARERINIWHGSSNNWINMIKELIGNSRDIFKKNNTKNNKIDIIIHNKNRIEFIDNASGIPVEGTASDGKPNYVAIFETPFAGSNYNNDNGIETVGQNGIFLFTLSMSSKNIEYFIARPNKNIYNISYFKGEINKELSIVGTSDETYSRIIFELDEDVWENPNFTFDSISEIAKVQASKGNARITVKDIESNQERSFYYENGMEEYFNEMTLNKTKVTNNIFLNTNKEFNVKVRGNDVIEKFSTNIIFAYSNDNEEDFKKELLNTADLTQFGTLQEGMVTGIKNSVHKWLKDNGKYEKNEKNITYEDVFTGLNYVSDNTSLYVEYENQTKVKTSTERYKTIMKAIMEEFLEIFFIENKTQAEAMCNQILVNKRAREKSDIIRNDFKKKLQGDGKTKKVEGLQDCDKDTPFEDREIWFCEGLSPSQTMSESRDEKTMAIYGLRGRFINSLKSSVKDVLNNSPALGIINSVGCGITIPKIERKLYKDFKTFNKSDLKYNRLIIATDSDSFGHGITLSLIAFFYTYMEDVLKDGHVYISISPRYEITYKDELIFAYNEEEKNKMVEDFKQKGIKVNVGIVKGLGQLNSDVFWEYVMNPKNRILKQITYEGAEEIIKKYFDILIGEDITGRKEYVKENITKANLSEID